MVTVEMLGLGTVDRGVNEQHRVMIHLGAFMLGCPIQQVTRWPVPTVVLFQAVRRWEEPGRLGAVRPLLQEEVTEVIPEVRTEEVVVSTRLAAVEESLGDSLEALREGPGEAPEGRGEDLAVPREVPEPLALRRAAPNKRTGS